VVFLFCLHARVFNVDVTIYLSALGHVLRVSGAETSSGEGTQMADAAVSVLDQLVQWKRDSCAFLMPARYV
jgi:hypothetical protein